MKRFVSEDELNRIKEQSGKDPSQEEYDPRPLWEKLQAQRDKKEDELRDRVKHKPPMSLDTLDVIYLDSLQQEKALKESLIAQEEERALSAFSQLKGEILVKVVESSEDESVAPAPATKKRLTLAQIKHQKQLRAKTKNPLKIINVIDKKGDPRTTDRNVIKSRLENASVSLKARESSDSPRPISGASSLLAAYSVQSDDENDKEEKL